MGDNEKQTGERIEGGGGGEEKSERIHNLALGKLQVWGGGL